MDIRGEGLHYEGISKFTEDVALFLKCSIERAMIVIKDKIGVISTQLYVTFGVISACNVLVNDIHDIVNNKIYFEG